MMDDKDATVKMLSQGLIGILLLLALWGLTGCVTPMEGSLRIEGDPAKNEPHHWRVVEDIPSGTRVFHSNLQSGALKHCRYKYTSERMAELRQTDPNQSWFYGCTYIVKPQIVVGQSLFTQLQGPISAGIFGALFYGAFDAMDADSTVNQNSATGGTGLGGQGGMGGAGGVGMGGAGGRGGSVGPINIRNKYGRW